MLTLFVTKTLPTLLHHSTLTSCRNQSIDLQYKSIVCSLYDRSNDFAWDIQPSINRLYLTALTSINHIYRH